MSAKTRRAGRSRITGNHDRPDDEYRDLIDVSVFLPAVSVSDTLIPFWFLSSPTVWVSRAPFMVAATARAWNLLESRIVPRRGTHLYIAQIPSLPPHALLRSLVALRHLFYQSLIKQRNGLRAGAKRSIWIDLHGQWSSLAATSGTLPTTLKLANSKGTPCTFARSNAESRRAAFSGVSRT